MHSDSRGLPLTFDDKTAARFCSDATESFVRRQTDTIPLLQQALTLEPENTIAQAMFGLMLHGARKSSLHIDIGSALATAKQSADSATERERLYVSALEQAVDGNLFGMVSCYEKILHSHPTDLLALSLAQGELFWLGEMQHSLHLSEMVRHEWNESTVGFPEYLGVLAFDLEEAGRYTQAEAAGRQSVALRNTNAWGTHAVAHVLYMQGRHREGIDWLADKHHHWTHTNQIKFHIWWHQCLFHLEAGEYETVLNHYDQWIRNHDNALVQVTPDLYIDMQNGASMLWRLEQQGVSVGRRWEELAEYTIPRLGDMSSPFTSAHYAVILAATGQYDLCQSLIKHMKQYSNTSSHTLSARYQHAALPAAMAAIAHRKGNFQEVVDILMPNRHMLWQMGGSHAQQDLFHQILVDAAAKLQQKTIVSTLLREIEAIGFTTPIDHVGYSHATADNSMTQQ